MKDQLGRLITLPQPAIRIVCLVPSITELIADLGLEEQLVGRTKFCIYPPSLKENTPQVGGTKEVHHDKIRSLKPDLIIANKEENTKEIVEELSKDFPVYVSNIQTIHSAIDMIIDVGRLTGKEEKAESIVQNIEQKRIDFHQNKHDEKKSLYLIWQNPFMTIGKDTFIYHMLQECGLESVIHDFRYPEISAQYINNCDADYILLSSEPFPFKGKHQLEIQKLFPNKKCILVDGTYFSWYGSRLVHSYSYFEKLLLSL